MAYSSTPGLVRTSAGSIDGTALPNVWSYSTADTDATAKAANYFATDAFNRGVRVGDTIFVNVVGTGLYIHSVLTVTSAACTVTQTPATST